MKTKKKKNKCIEKGIFVSGLAVLVLVSSILGTSVLQGAVTEKTEFEKPMIKKSSTMEAGQKVTWDCVWFGEYPQTEVKLNDNEFTKLSALVDADWNENGDTEIGGKKYRRIKKSDATLALDGKDSYYSWSDTTTYHYFRYDPIKWRVLHVGDTLLLLSDVVLDSQKYSTTAGNITWKKSNVRSWLNGYKASANSAKIDYSTDNFISVAFSQTEQAKIADTTIVNRDNYTYGRDGGSDTTDKLFLLSESEVYTGTAQSYGFVSNFLSNDEARQSKSSDYAKAMGLWSYTNTGYTDNCNWLLRSPGGEYSVTYINHYGYVDNLGTYVHDGGNGIRVALNLKLSDVDMSFYAGTVCSDGTVSEIEPGVSEEITTTEKQTTEKKTTEKQTTEKQTTEKQTTEKQTTEKQTTEKPTTEKPTIEKPTTVKPTTEKRTTEQQTTQKQTTEKQTTEKQTTAKPTTAKVTTEKKTTQKETTEKQTTEKQTTEKPTTAKPTTAKVTTEKKTTQKETTEKQTTEKQTTEKQTTEKPTTAKVTTEKKTTQKETTEKQTTEKQTTEKPTTAKVTTEKKTTEKQTTEKQTTEKQTTEKQTTEDKHEEETTVPILNAELPRIEQEPADRMYSYGNKAYTIKYKVSVSDGGTLSYQWYGMNSRTGTPKRIQGATMKEYRPSTANVGVKFYYCEITNTNPNATGNKVARAKTRTLKITVQKAYNRITGVNSYYGKTIGQSSFILNAQARGNLYFESLNTKIAKVDAKSGKVTITGVGSTYIKIKAGSTYYRNVEKRVRIRVNPKKQSITAISSPSKKALNVKWNRHTGITGYKIKYATNKDFKGAKYVSVLGGNRNSKTIYGLISGKTYYVQIRTYRRINTTDYMGDWSSIKTCKIR